MRHGFIILTLIAMAGCAERGARTAIDLCAHKPGCISIQPQEQNGPAHAREIAPANFGGWIPQ